MDAASSTLNDQEVLERYYRDHDPAWIGLLLERYLHLIVGVCFRYLKEKEAAKDLTQQVCFKVLKDLRRHRVQHFKSWLYQVTKNECLMKLRDSKRHGWIHLDESAHLDIQVEDSRSIWDQEARYRKLDKALDQLNDAQRRCISLFYLNKNSYQEIADQTGFSLMQVKSHIQNGKRNLRSLMEAAESDASHPPHKR